MTFEEKITEMLVECGMWPEEAAEVIALAKEDKVIKKSSLRWHYDITTDPDTTLAALWINVKWIALKWIDENAPQAFYRSELES